MKLIFTLVSIKKIQVNDNDQKYILFRIDIYFTKHSLAVETDEKSHTIETLNLKKKDKRH